MPSAYQQTIENDLPCAQLQGAFDTLTGARDVFEHRLCGGDLPAFGLVRGIDDLDVVRPIAQAFSQNCDDVFILGTGGSSLGGRTLCGVRATSRPVLHFVDNIDPWSLRALVAGCDLSRTGLIAVSKSGATSETLAQLMALLPFFQTRYTAQDLRRFVVVMTEPCDNPLRRLARRLGLGCLDHDPNIGGRYSVFSRVGLLPALIAGLDVGALRRGAEQVLDGFLSARSLADSAPAYGAALSVELSARRDIRTTVLMPYEDRLADLGFWFNQLWAESLGKDGKGTTPIRALGTVDQHSQLQLYLDGPADKFFTLLNHDSRGEGWSVDRFIADDDALDYLRGRSLGDLFYVSAAATREALASRGCPVRHLLMQAIDERTMGAVMMHFMLETVLAAALWGVDPYGQPAVEQGKIIARQRLRAMG